MTFAPWELLSILFLARLASLLLRDALVPHAPDEEAWARRAAGAAYFAFLTLAATAAGLLLAADSSAEACRCVLLVALGVDLLGTHLIVVWCGLLALRVCETGGPALGPAAATLAPLLAIHCLFRDRAHVWSPRVFCILLSGLIPAWMALGALTLHRATPAVVSPAGLLAIWAYLCGTFPIGGRRLQGSGMLLLAVLALHGPLDARCLAALAACFVVWQVRPNPLLSLLLLAAAYQGTLDARFPAAVATCCLVWIREFHQRESSEVCLVYHLEQPDEPCPRCRMLLPPEVMPQASALLRARQCMPSAYARILPGLGMCARLAVVFPSLVPWAALLAVALATLPTVDELRDVAFRRMWKETSVPASARPPGVRARSALQEKLPD